jgi:hypothetical protein
MVERKPVRWLQLNYRVPSEPSQKRVRVWRKLQSLGAYALPQSTYILPATPEVEKQFRHLAREIEEMEGEASVFEVTALDDTTEQRLLAGLVQAREEEYRKVLRVCARFLEKAATVIASRSWNEQIHAEFVEVLDHVHVLYRAARRHDLLGIHTAALRAEAAEALATCEHTLRALVEGLYDEARRILDHHLPGNLESAIAEETSADLPI